jgi:hypothetical protein
MPAFPYTHTIEDGTVVAATERAILVVAEELPLGKSWVPRTQIDDWGEIGSRAARGDTGCLIINRWWAEKDGMVE